MRIAPSSRTFARRLSALVVTAGLVLAPAAVPAFAAPSTAPSASPSAGTGESTKSTKSTKSAKTAKDKPTLQTFGIGPGNAKGLDTRSAFVFSGRPGTVVKDNVALVNYTTKPQQAKIYASDAFTTDTGAYDVLAEGATSKDVGAWIDLKPQTVTIPARKSATSVKPGTLLLPFTLTVPNGAAPGDHAGGIVVSVRTKGAEGTNAVVVDRRVGTRVYMRVAGPLDPSLNLAGLSVSYDGPPAAIAGGLTRISYTVRNTGNVVLSARQDVRVDGWLGIGTARPTTAPTDLVQLLPGAAVNVTVDVDGVLPTFRPSAVVTLVPYTGTAEAPIELPAVSASKAFWAVPWALVAIVALLLLSLLGWQVLRRRRSRPLGAHTSPEPEPELVTAR